MAKEKLASRFGRSVYIWKDLNQYSWFNSLHDKAVYIYICVCFFLILHIFHIYSRLHGHRFIITFRKLKGAPTFT